MKVVKTAVVVDNGDNSVGTNDKIVYTITIRNTGSCLLYTSPSPRDGLLSRMPSSA